MLTRRVKRGQDWSKESAPPYPRATPPPPTRPAHRPPPPNDLRAPTERGKLVFHVACRGWAGEYRRRLAVTGHSSIYGLGDTGPRPPPSTLHAGG